MRIEFFAAPPLGPESATDLQELWGEKAELHFTTVLHDRKKESIQDYLPDPGDKVLMYVLEDGEHVLISVDKLAPALERDMARMADQADLLFLFCGGDFSPLKAPKLLVQPNMIFRDTLANMLNPSMKLGILLPSEGQIPHVRASWLPYLQQRGLSPDQLVLDWAAPDQGIPKVEACASRMAAQGVDIVAVECFGFKDDIRPVISAKTHTPVILIRTMIAQIIKDLVKSF